MANDFVSYITTQEKVRSGARGGCGGCRGCRLAAPRRPCCPHARRLPQVDATYRDQAAWTRMSIMSTAGSGKFSTDRTINDYNNEIWKAEACPVPSKA